MGDEPDRRELAAFDSKNERMVVGGLAGYVVAGPLGGLAGAYIGRQWD